MSNNLSGPYRTQDEAAMGGFKKVMGGTHPNKYDEYAFYIIAVPKDGQLTFHYTTPPEKLGPNGGELTFKLAKGQLLRAYCHSHPERISEQNFSSDDFEEYERKIRLHPFLATWYLLTPKEQIRVARNKTEFREGKSVQWIPSVQP
jgi:hypothetical protein